MSVDSEAFAYASRSVAITPADALHVVAFAPMSLYTGPVERTRNDMIVLAALMLLVSLPLIYWGSPPLERCARYLDPRVGTHRAAGL